MPPGVFVVRMEITGIETILPLGDDFPPDQILSAGMEAPSVGGRPPLFAFTRREAYRDWAKLISEASCRR